MMRRIQRAQDKEEFIQLVIGFEGSPFTEIWRLILFAGHLGWKLRKRTPLGATASGKAIPETYFSNCPAWPGALYLIALTDTESTDFLSGTEDSDAELIRMFEEYANTGLEFLMDRVPSGALDAVRTIEIVDDFEANEQKTSLSLETVSL